MDCRSSSSGPAISRAEITPSRTARSHSAGVKGGDSQKGICDLQVGIQDVVPGGSGAASDLSAKRAIVSAGPLVVPWLEAVKDQLISVELPTKLDVFIVLTSKINKRHL